MTFKPNAQASQGRLQTKKVLRQLGLALSLSATLLSSWAFEVPGDGVYADRIDWAVLMDLSGPTAANEVPWTNGVKAYIRKVNEEGGIHGRKINLLVEAEILIFQKY